MESAKSEINSHQNVIVMRHGDRMDLLEPLWASTAESPWDSPIVQDGMARAFQTGQRIRSQLGFPIHRVFVSPFLRCIQTANEVIAALSAVHFDPNAMSSKDVPSIDNTKLKVAIEFGLCKIMNTRSIKSDSPPKHKKFEFNIKDLEAMFPEGTVDSDVDMVYKEVPYMTLLFSFFICQNQYEKSVSTNSRQKSTFWIKSSELEFVETLYKISDDFSQLIYIENSSRFYIKFPMISYNSFPLRRQILNNDDVFDKFLEFEVVTSHGVSFKHHTVPIHHPVINQSPV